MTNYGCNVCGYKGKTKEEMREHIGDKHSNLIHTKTKNRNLKKFLVTIVIIILAIPYALIVGTAFGGLGNPQTTTTSYILDLLITISPIIIIYIGYRFSRNNLKSKGN
jgi:hypothetical protein